MGLADRHYMRDDWNRPRLSMTVAVMIGGSLLIGGLLFTRRTDAPVPVSDVETQSVNNVDARNTWNNISNATQEEIHAITSGNQSNQLVITKEQLDLFAKLQTATNK